jgi:hypothetical protein
LRLEAIDALETHYSRTGASQPLSLGHAARDEVLKWVGFTSVTHDPVAVE